MTEFATLAAVILAVLLYAAYRLQKWLRRFTRKHRGAIGFVTGLAAGRQVERRKSQPPPPAGPDRPTALYRHYDSQHRLLYVGITDCARGGKRWMEHEADKPWFHLVATSRIDPPYPTRGAALYAEAVAIRDENPVHNIQRPDPRAIGRRAS